MAPPIRFALTEDEVSIAYTVHGDGPPLVYVRGWISHLDVQWLYPDYRLFMEALGRHFTVIRYDMRSNGLSERNVLERLALDDLALDLIAVLEATNVDRATFLTTCYGGPIFARYASLQPDSVERVVLDGPYARGEELGGDDMRDSILATVRLMRSQPKATLSLLDHFTNPKGEGPLAGRQDMSQGIDADVAEALYRLSFELDVTKDFLQLQAPALVTHRQRSKAVPVELGRKVAALVPDAMLVTQEGSNTNPWNDDASEILHAMGSFLGADLVAGYQPRTAVRPTVVLFSDIVESTSTASQLGDDAAHRVSRAFLTLSKDAIDARGGRLVKSMGDGVMAEFPSVSQAVGCAVDMQHAFGEMPVRIGINAGEPVSEDDDLHGIVVSTAARVCAQGLAGEIMVSNVVRELATGKGFVFEPIGERHLKGIGSVPLFKVAY
ncbi:MAG: adenylate/guanylate cyclase domain-containing protein [Acidimicrobiales bacterium]|nr:adenylate/guanylate cyclase domain-containing protein [Acidimicrobiales bacterium]